MLDIEYIKQIDEVLEVEGWDFHYKPHESKLGGGYLDYHEKRCSIFGLSMPNSIMYELYLVRVIEAINKKNFNEGSYSFSYQILTEIDNYHVYDKYKEKTLERFYFGKRHDYDTKKEKAITYIMDHIKEKV